MSATKAFDLVTDAYQKASGQTTKKAKEEVAEALARSWAQSAFGASMASRIESTTEPEQTEEGEES